MRLNKWILAACLVLSVAMATGGTLAYLTDRESTANVLTFGNVEIELNEDFQQGVTLLPGKPETKTATIENTGKNKAYVWATVAVPQKLDGAVHFKRSEGEGWFWQDAHTEMEHDGVMYNVYTALYGEELAVGGVTGPVIESLALDAHVDIAPDGMINLVENGVAQPTGWNVKDVNGAVVYVSAYAMQAEGFDNVTEAYNAYNKQWTTEGANGVNNGIEWATPGTLVSTEDELREALAAGKNVILNANIALDADKTITIPTGKNVTIDLGDKTLSGTAKGTTNREMILVKGELTVKNGTAEMTVTQEQNWNAMSTIFDVTTGGVLNLENVELDNKGGTSMNFCVHLNNWGEVTLNVTDSVLKATYIPVRVFNSGNDMNNVSIRNTTLDGKYDFWVHNYSLKDFGNDQAKHEAAKARLNFDLYNGTNTFKYTNTIGAPVLYGYYDAIYFDKDGNQITVTNP